MATVAKNSRTNQVTLGSSSAGPFNVGFRLFDDDALEVYVDGVIQTVTTDYTISASFSNGYTDAATITFTSAQASGSVIDILGDMAPDRESDYTNGSPGIVQNMNIELGRVWAAISEIKRNARRSIRSRTGSLSALLDTTDGVMHIEGGVPKSGPTPEALIAAGTADHNYRTRALMTASETLLNGMTAQAAGEPFLIDTSSPYTANGDTVLTLTGITGQAISYRLAMTSDEFDADTRPQAFWTALGNPVVTLTDTGQRLLPNASGTNRTNAASANFDLLPGILSGWQGVEALGGAVDGATNDSTPLAAFLAASADRWGKVVATTSAVSMDSGETLSDVKISAAVASQAISFVASAERIRIMGAEIDNSTGMAAQLNAASVSKIDVAFSDLSGLSYGFLVNQSSTGSSEIRSIGNSITATNGDAIAWNFPEIDVNYLMSMGDIVEGGLSGASSSSGFSWSNSNGKDWVIAGGVSKGSRQEALHIESGQQGGAVGVMSLANNEEDAVRIAGPRGIILTGVSGTFVAGETVTGGTSGATAIVLNVTATKLEVRSITGTFAASETITGGTSAATATVDEVPQNEADGVPFVGINGTHSGVKTGFSGLRAHLKTDHQPTRGTSLVGAFFRGFEYVVYAAERTWLMADNVAGAASDFLLQLGKGAKQFGTILGIDKPTTALIEADGRSHAGVLIAQEQPDLIIDYVGASNIVGATCEGWAFPFDVAHGGSGTETFAMTPLPTRCLGQITAYLDSGSNNVWATAWIDYDGTTLTVSDLTSRNRGNMSAATFAVSGSDLCLQIFSNSSTTTTAFVKFHGAWYQE